MEGISNNLVRPLYSSGDANSEQTVKEGWALLW